MLKLEASLMEDGGSNFHLLVHLVDCFVARYRDICGIFGVRLNRDLRSMIPFGRGVDAGKGRVFLFFLA